VSRPLRLESRQHFALPPEGLFGFFADARNLERITPGWLRFEIVGAPPESIDAGTLIDYRLRWRGIPLRWRTRIDEWDPPHRFVDRQLRGPYRLWVHEHRFTAVDGGTVMEDSVDFAAPGGRLVGRLLVRPDVERIFAHRRRVLRELFPEKARLPEPGV
jgi:ligand-binding SRPBCC domain-containing protein